MSATDTSALLAALEATEKAVDELSRKADVTEAEIRKSRRRDRILAVSLAFDVLLSVLLFIAGAQISSNQDKVNHLQHTQKVQSDTTRAAQCTMVRLFLSIEQRQIALKTITPEQRDAYGVLVNIGRDLSC